MRNLRKDTGGYALLYVLVVIILLCAVAMMICTVSMQNLTAQQKSVERMADKYAAQGEVEKFKAVAVDLNSLGIANREYKAILDSNAENSGLLNTYIDKLGAEITVENFDEISGTGAGNYLLKATIKKQQNDISVVAEMNINVRIAVTMKGEPDPTDSTQTIQVPYYYIDAVESEFTSYTIENGGAA